MTHSGWPCRIKTISTVSTVLSPVVSDPSSSPSGWFPDPLDRYDHRYFNGTSWTSDVSADGVRSVDPLGAGPGPGSGPGGDRSNKAATAAVVMGSVSLVIAWMPFLVVAGLALAVLAVVFGLKGLRRSRHHGLGRGASIAGLVMGCSGLAASVVGVILTVLVWNEVVDFAEPGPHATTVVSCDVDGRTADVAGTITNDDDRPHDYTLFVEVDGRTEIVVVEDVAAGETTDWSTIVVGPTIFDECDPGVIVQGPFPFGVEVDPVRS